MKRFNRLWVFVGLIVVTALVLIWSSASVPPISDPSAAAARRARDIIIACREYHDSPANPSSHDDQQYPRTLADLVNPFGGPSLLRNGPDDLLDPWGHPFEYIVSGDAQGEIEVRVWAVHETNGKRREVGAVRRANGTIELFGL